MVSLEQCIAPRSVGTKRVNERQPIAMKRLRHLTSHGSGPVRGAAACIALWGCPLNHLLNLDPVARSAARRR